VLTKRTVSNGTLADAELVGLQDTVSDLILIVGINAVLVVLLGAARALLYELEPNRPDNIAWQSIYSVLIILFGQDFPDSAATDFAEQVPRHTSRCPAVHLISGTHSYLQNMPERHSSELMCLLSEQHGKQYQFLVGLTSACARQAFAVTAATLSFAGFALVLALTAQVVLEVRADANVFHMCVLLAGSTSPIHASASHSSSPSCFAKAG